MTDPHITVTDADTMTSAPAPDYVKVALQGGAALIGVFLVYWVTIKLDGKVEHISTQLNEHVITGRVLSEYMEKQTDAQIQSCIMLASLAKKQPLDCYRRTDRAAAP